MFYSRLSKLIAATLIIVALPAFAMTLDEAKHQGLVGEKTNGYLGSVSGHPNSEVKALIEDINAKRKALYIEKAAKAGVEPKIMEMRTGQRLQQRAPAGEYIQTQDGQWKRK